MPQLPSLIQEALGPAYDVERELTGGGMARVVVARDNRLGRRVVVKILPPDLAASVSVDRFRREIMVAAALQHPHIIPILNAGEVQGLPFLVMPFVEGESLRARIARGPLGVVETVRALRDVARALAYAHAHGVVHRDIKPDNVLLAAGSAMVADFGVAKALSFARETSAASDATITVVGTSLGTPAYMSPEQIAADPALDHRADLYGFGIMAYEMLAGRTPFHGRSPQALFAAQLTERPRDLSEHRDDLPAALCALIMQCLEKDPAARPQSADMIVAALDDPAVISGAFATPTPSAVDHVAAMGALTGAAEPAARATTGEAIRGVPMPPHGWFHGWRAALVVVSAVILLAGGAAALLGVRTPSPSRTDVPALATGAVPVASIAVLPLVFIGGDSAHAYLADGLTNEITSALADVRGLRVASRSASGALQRRLAAGEPVDTSLGALLEGTVQREGNRLRVTARLVNARDGFTVWSDVYEQDAGDVFALQDGVTTAVVRALSEHFDLEPPAAMPAASAAADSAARRPGYSDYLRGRFFFDRRGAESLRAARRYLERSISADSTFAPAWSGLANVYAVLPLYGDGVAVDSIYRTGLAAATRAIALDSTLADGYAARGNLLNAMWQWSAAARDFERALALSPSQASAHQWYGEHLLVNGLAEEAIRHLRRAAELDPVSPIITGSYAVALGVGGRADSSLARARLAVELDPELAVTRLMLGTVHLYAGEIREAIRDLEIALALSDSAAEARGMLGYAYARAGMPAQAEVLLRSFDRQPARGAASIAIARIYLGYGDREKALAWLERAVDAHAAFFSSESMASPLFDSIRGDPRFARLVFRIGLDAAILTASPRGPRA